jgi:hypothetical protein
MDDKIKFISAPYRVDRKLYKYYSNIGFAIDCIKRHRVHLDNPHNFNDPFEAKWGFSYYSLLETVKPADSIFDEIFEYIKRLPIHYQTDHHSSILLALVHSDFNTTYGSKKLSIKVAIHEIYESFSNVDFTFEEFCKDVKQKALDFPAPSHFGLFYEVPNGKYKGVVLNWHYGWEDRWIIAIGKRYDDIYVFTHDYNFGTYEDNETDIAFTEWAWLFINERYFNINDSQQRILDLEKLASNEAAMDYIMSNLDKMDSNCELFYAIEGDDLWHCIGYK